MVGSKNKTTDRNDCGPNEPGRANVLQHVSRSLCQMVNSYSKNKGLDFPGVEELRMSVLAGLPATDSKTL